MLFCPRPTMKRHLGALIALAVSAISSCGAPRADRASARHSLAAPRGRSGDARSRRRRPRRTACSSRSCSSAPCSASTRSASPSPGTRPNLERLAGRPGLRVPPRPDGDLGRRLAGDLRRRALHDRTHPRSEGAGPDVALGLRGSGRDRDARTRRPSASVSRGRTPSACPRSISRSSRRRRSRGRRRRWRPTASPSAAGPTASHPGNRIRRSGSCGAPETAGRRAPASRRSSSASSPTARSRFQAGSRGELDEFRISRDQKKAAEADPDFLAPQPDPQGRRSSWSCCSSGTARTPFLADPRVRRALALAWPREEAAKRLYPPDGASLISGPYPAGRTRERARRRAAARGSGGGRAAPGGGGLERPRPGSAPAQGRPEGVGRAAVSRRASRSTRTWPRSCAARTRRSASSWSPRPLDWAAFSQRARRRGVRGAARPGSSSCRRTSIPIRYFHSSQWPPRGAEHRLLQERGGGPRHGGRAPRGRRRQADRGCTGRSHRILAADPPADFLWGVDQYWAVSKRVEGVQISPLGLFHFLPGPLGWRPATSSAAGRVAGRERSRDRAVAAGGRARRWTSRACWRGPSAR